MADCVDALLESTQALAEALASGSDDALAAALASRAEALLAVRSEVGESPPAALREQLDRIAELDREIVAIARAGLDRIGDELRELHRARQSLAALRPADDEPARFVSRRA